MPFMRGAMAARPARTRPVRLTLFGLLILPVVSLVALWGVAVGSTLGSAVTEHVYNTVTTKIGAPTQALTADLTQEQAQTYIWLSTGGRSPVAPLDAARRRTNIVVPEARSALEAIQGKLPPAGVHPLAVLFAQLGQLGNIRSAIDSGSMTPSTAFQAYSKVIDSEFQFFFRALRVQDASLYQQTIGTTDASRALVQAGREMVLVGGALAARGQMSTASRQLFANSVTSQRLLMGDAQVLLDSSVRAQYVRAYSLPASQRFVAMEDLIAQSAGRSGPIPVNPATWESASAAFLAATQKAETQNTVFLDNLSNRLSSKLVTQAVLAGGLGLVAVLASVFLMLWFGRRLAGELTGLHRSARSMAEDRLPSVVERLRRGDDVDVAAESPPPPPGKITEIVKVAEAFATVQRTAVEAAVGQANLRKGVNQVFLNLSLRNQSLLHRQLGMLDTMERAASDPAALADLFRLDHLTTRMRRHAEGLIILSGATPGRGWRDPVAAVDVLRAAIAEVEDYVRVDVISESRDAVVGAAVNDVIHLIAELVENATAFSPPNTQVEIKAEGVGNGFAVEIEDRGLGLSAGEMAEINERLARPPEFDLANSDQLGLFVVGQLAARHGIKVALRDSPYGGTRAIVLLPRSIIVREGEKGEQAELGSGGPPAAVDSPAGPAPAQATADVDRQRAAVFSLTGRHRLESSPEDEAASEFAQTAPQARAARRSRTTGDSWQEPPWEQAPWEQNALQADPLQADLPQADPSRADPPQENSWQESPSQEDTWEQVPRQRDTAPRTTVPDSRPEGTSARKIEGQVGADQAVIGTHLGLPVRVRQASLAPQLRANPRPDSPASSAVGGPVARSPEQARNLMAALQKGWEHGRTDDLDNPMGNPGDWPGDTPSIDSAGQGTDPSDGEAG
jgi:signal transduction histidine kinase